MVRVKICGITNLQDGLGAISAGADALGFVFYKRSKRFVEFDRARSIVSALPPFVYKVGVFVNEDPKFVLRIAKEVGLSAVQLHGDEDPDTCRYLAGHVEVIKAFRVAEDGDVEAVFKYECEGITPLFDTKVSEYGGSGKTFDWRILKPYVSQLEYFVLSGGLTPENVGEAVKVFSPYAVDVSSGVEAYPGKKDPEKMKLFVKRAKGL